MPGLDRSLIAALPQFKGLSPHDLDLVLEHARSSRYAKDAPVFEQGSDAHSFFLLLDGHIRVVRATPEGHQVVVRYINKGELFGIAMAMGLSAYPATAVAAVDCVVLAWPNREWPVLSSKVPAFGASAYQTIGTRLQETHEKVEALATAQVEQRVASTVLRLVSQSGRKTDRGIEIDFPITRQDIAEMTGTTLHTVSRILSAWEAEGLVEGGRQKVIVTDPHALMLIAENRKRKQP